MKNLFKTVVCVVFGSLLVGSLPSFAGPVSVTQEINGERVSTVFDSIPKRAVSLSQFSTEMLLTLGLKEQMVGTAFLEEPISPKVADEYAEVPVLAEKWPSLEVFMAANPDFAIGWAVAFSKRGVEAQNILSRGVKVFIPRSTIDFDADMETLMDDFLTIGAIFGVEDRAEALVTSQRERISAAMAKAGSHPSKKIFIYDSGDAEPFTVYEGFTTNLFKLVGGENILSGKGVQKTWGKANWEEVVAADPDTIVVIEYNVSIRDAQTDGDSKILWLKNNPKLKGLKAVKNDSFVKVSLADICPGIRNVDAIEKLSAALYGE